MKLYALLPLLAVLGTGSTKDCSDNDTHPKSASGVVETSVRVPMQPNGLTIEQENVRNRLLEDNKPGAIKHLYVISAFSGQVILYSTVRGKVTSSGKRLSPYHVVVGASGEQRLRGFSVLDGDVTTDEVLQDDGTYGTSTDYIYWWDTKGVYHQHYISGGQIVHVSSQPLNVPRIIINLNEGAGH